MASDPITSWKRDGGKKWKHQQTLCYWATKLLWIVIAAMKWKDACSFGGGSYDKQHIKKQKYGFVDKGPYTKNSVFFFFFDNHIWMSVLVNKEQWALKNLCFWTVVLDKTLESPLDSKEIKQVNPKGNQSWIFTEGLMLKLKLPYFGYLKWRANSLDKTLMLRAGREEGDRGWDDWVKSSTQWTWVWTNSG